MTSRTLTDHEESLLVAYRRFGRSCDHSTRTVDARVAFARQRLAVWGIGGFTEPNVRDYFADMHEQIAERHGDKKKVWTMATYHGHLADFCAWAVAAGHMPTDPMKRIPRPRPPKLPPKPLTLAQIDDVLAAANGRTRDWMLLALNAGLRVSEIARLRGEDFTDEHVHVDGKGGSSEALPLSPELVAIRERYPSVGYWFPGTDHGHVRSTYISRDVSKVFRECGITSGSAHRLRHSFATYLLRGGVHIRTVQKLMRHANLETTAGYTAVDGDELAAAVGTLRFGRTPAA